MPNAIQIVFLILSALFLGFAVFKFAKALKNLIVAKRNKKKKALEDKQQEVEQ